MKEIIIKLSDSDYESVKQFGLGSKSIIRRSRVAISIKEGTVLPEHHGRLIDADTLTLMDVHLIDGKFLCDAPTILEADKEQKE